MLNHTGFEKVYLACGGTDMRKSIDGLAALVQEGFALDPFSPSLFVFCNKSRNKLKILQWDHNGFWLHYRRLEKGKFEWPDGDKHHPVATSRRELNWLLDGLSLRQTQAHHEVAAKIAI
jgi:transposase